MRQQRKQGPSLLERWTHALWANDFDPDPASPSEQAEEVEAPKQRRLGVGWKVAMAEGLGVTQRTKPNDEQEHNS